MEANKEAKKSEGKALGEIMNKLFNKPEPFTIEAGGRKFDLFIHPISMPDFDEVIKTISGGEFSEDSIRLCICKSLKDSDGHTVWDKPEEIQLPPILYARLKMAVIKVNFNIDLEKLMAERQK